MNGRSPKRLRAFIAACVYISSCEDGDMPIIEEYARVAAVKKHVFRRYIRIVHDYFNATGVTQPADTAKSLPPPCIEGVVASLKDLIRRYLIFARRKQLLESSNSGPSTAQLKGQKLLALKSDATPTDIATLLETSSADAAAATSPLSRSPAIFPSDTDPIDDLLDDWPVECRKEESCVADVALDELFFQGSQVGKVTKVDLNFREEDASEKIFRHRWEEMVEKIVRKIGVGGFTVSRIDRKNMAVESGQVLLVAGKLAGTSNSIISLKWMSEFLNVNKSVLSSSSVSLGQRLMDLAVAKGVIGKAVANAVGSTEIKGIKGRVRWAIMNVVDL